MMVTQHPTNPKANIIPGIIMYSPGISRISFMIQKQKIKLAPINPALNKTAFLLDKPVVSNVTL